jgi:monoamine oxidase
VPQRGLELSAELGPEFVHGGNPLLRAALREAGIRIERVRRDLWARDDGRGWRRQHDYWRELARLAARIPPRTQTSFAQFLKRQRRLPPDERVQWRAYAEGFNAAPASRLSAETVRLEHGGVDEPQSRPTGGYCGLVESLVTRLQAAGGELRLGEPVAAVRWRRGSVEVRTPRRTFRASALVITLPLGVLQARAVRFTPALREKQKIIRRLGWGQVARVTLRFDAGFWRSRIVPDELRWRGKPMFGFLAMAEGEFPTWWAPSPQAPVMVAWQGGPGAKPVLTLSDRQIVARALHSLAEGWGCSVRELRRHLRGSCTHNWSRDPFARGAYSYSVAGFEHGPELLARPVANTLFFAGEATAEELGTVHGALASGVRAAEEVLAVR